MRISCCFIGRCFLQAPNNIVFILCEEVRLHTGLFEMRRPKSTTSSSTASRISKQAAPPRNFRDVQDLCCPELAVSHCRKYTPNKVSLWHLRATCLKILRWKVCLEVPNTLSSRFKAGTHGWFPGCCRRGSVESLARPAKTQRKEPSLRPPTLALIARLP